MLVTYQQQQWRVCGCQRQQLAPQAAATPRRRTSSSRASSSGGGGGGRTLGIAPPLMSGLRHLSHSQLQQQQQQRPASPTRLRRVELSAMTGGGSGGDDGGGGDRRADNEAAPLMYDAEAAAPAAAAGPRRGGGAGIDWVATGLCFLFPAIGGLLFGYDIGASSGVLASLTSAELSGTAWGPGLSSFESGLIVSFSLLGALLGSTAALTAGNRLGRRTELMLASALYGAGAGGMGVAGGLPALLLCRVLYGLGIGFAMHAAPAYIAETAPPSVRGVLISLKEAAIVGGILAGFWAGLSFIGEVGGWRSIYGVAAPLALVLGVGMAALPESPRYLLLSGAGREEAVRALVRAEGRAAADVAAVEAEVDAMAASLRSDDAVSAAAAAPTSAIGEALGVALFREQRYRRPLLVGLSLMLLQQVSGQPSVLYYANQIFEQAGFGGGAEAASVSVLLGGFKLLMTLVAVATVDRLGRRPLLLGGAGAMTLALLLLSAAQGGVVDAAAAGGGGAAAVASAAWVSAAALLLYVGGYQLGFGPCSWLIVGEVFPARVRGQAIALATIVNFSSNFLVSLALPTLQQALGMRAIYGGFACVAAGAVWWINVAVPETKGKTLEEIEALWRSK